MILGHIKSSTFKIQHPPCTIRDGKEQINNIAHWVEAQLQWSALLKSTFLVQGSQKELENIITKPSDHNTDIQDRHSKVGW